MLAGYNFTWHEKMACQKPALILIYIYCYLLNYHCYSLRSFPSQFSFGWWFENLVWCFHRGVACCSPDPFICTQEFGTDNRSSCLWQWYVAMDLMYGSASVNIKTVQWNSKGISNASVVRSAVYHWSLQSRILWSIPGPAHVPRLESVIHRMTVFQPS